MHLPRHAWLLAVTLPLACSRSSAPDAVPAPPAPAPPTLSPASSLPAAPSQALAPAPALPPAATSTVRLLDPGHEPRRALRYTWSPTQTERMDIELRTLVSADTGGSHQDVRLAPLEIAVMLEPRAVTPDGDVRLAWHVVSADVGAMDASSPSEVAAGWSAQLVPIQHLSGTATLSAHGVTRGVSLDAGATNDAGAPAEMVVQVMQMVRDVAAPLPDEPVGTGARWQRISTLDARSGRATQTDTYTLLDLQAAGGSLDDVLAQTASPQALPTPAGATAGPPAHMDQLLTSGDARTRFDLGRIVAQTKLDGTTSMAVSAPNSRMNMVMHLGITVRGSTP